MNIGICQFLSLSPLKRSKYAQIDLPLVVPFPKADPSQQIPILQKYCLFNNLKFKCPKIIYQFEGNHSDYEHLKWPVLTPEWLTLYRHRALSCSPGAEHKKARQEVQ